MRLTETQKRLLRWLGLPLLVTIVFVFTVHWTFPYDRLKYKAADLLAPKYDLTIQSIGPTFFPGGVIAKNVLMQRRQGTEEDKPPVIKLDKIRGEIGLFALLFRRYDIDVLLKLGGGSVEGDFLVNNAGIRARVATEDLPLQDIPGLVQAVGLPIEGRLRAEMSLFLPKRRWREADGRISLSCAKCTIGDGVAKLTPRRRSDAYPGQVSVFSQEGITVPRLDLGNLAAEIEIKSGIGEIKKFAASSPDGELIIEGSIRFADPFMQSTVPGCTLFRLSEALKRREPKFGSVPQLTGALIRPDGFAELPMQGTLERLRWRAQRRCTTRGGSRTPREKPTVTMVEGQEAAAAAPRADTRPEEALGVTGAQFDGRAGVGAGDAGVVRAPVDTPDRGDFGGANPEAESSWSGSEPTSLKSAPYDETEEAGPPREEAFPQPIPAPLEDYGQREGPIVNGDD